MKTLYQALVEAGVGGADEFAVLTREDAGLSACNNAFGFSEAPDLPSYLLKALIAITRMKQNAEAQAIYWARRSPALPLVERSSVLGPDEVMLTDGKTALKIKGLGP